MKRLLLVLGLVLLTACANTVSQDDAVASAQNFISGHVVLFAKDSGDRIPVNKADANVKDAQLVNGIWEITVQVSSQVKENEKSALIQVGVDASSGKVVTFNKQRVA